ncbi:MAG: Ig-like domain-containing protein, partial [Bacteroidota bacterium]|nr:Ig-like domain-containing protein [Bacteroidota bacterium]
MKNSIQFYLAFILMLFLTGSAFSQTTLKIESVSAIPGSDVTVHVDASQIADMQGFQFTIAYDNTKLKYKSVANWGGGTNSAAVQITDLSAAGQLTFVYNDNPVNITTGTFFDLTFTILTGTNGIADLKWSDNPTSRELSNSVPVIIPCTYTDGSITILSNVNVTGITLDKTSLSLITGGTSGVLTETVNPSNATNKNVTWSSSDTNVASVSNGVVSPLKAGKTIITVTTEDGNFFGTCNVDVYDPLTVNAGNDTSICKGGSVQLQPTVTGGQSPYTYQWTPAEGLSNVSVSNPIATPSITTTYTLLVTDIMSNVSSAQVVVMVNQAYVNLGTDRSICYGDSTMLYVSGGGTVIWNTGATSNMYWVRPITKTTYTVTMTDYNGCSGTDDIIVDVNKVSASAGSDVTINGGNTTMLTATGGIDYAWSNGILTANNEVSPSVTTSYTVTVTDANGCKGTAGVTVTVNNIPQLTLKLNNDTTICQGNSVQLKSNVTGGQSPYTYQWTPAEGLSNVSTSNPIATPSITTTYTLLVTDIMSNVSSAQVVVMVNQAYVNLGTDRSICYGDSTMLYVSGGGTVIWNTGATSNMYWVRPITKTTYTVTMTDYNGCSGTDDIIVDVNKVSASAGSDVTINGGNTTMLTATGGIDYAWSNGILTAYNEVSPSLTTSYTVTVTDANGCKGMAGVTVTVNNIPPITIAINNASICKGESVQLQPTVTGGQTPYIYQWTPAEGLSNVSVSSPIATPSITTTYTLLVTDNMSNVSSAQVVVTVNQAYVNLGTDRSICYGDSTMLYVSGGGTVIWNTGA